MWKRLELSLAATEGHKRAYVCALDESERGEWKSWLKLNIQKTEIMASGSITSWQMDGETVETVTDFILGVSKITYDDHSHEIKRRLLLGRKAMILDSILKSRDITLPTKVHLVKDMVFPVVMYGCENWTIKRAECWRTDAFELWCWRRFLRVYLTARRSNQSPKGYRSWVFIERTDVEAEALILWPPDAKSWLIWKDPDVGKDWGQEDKGTMRGWDGWMASPTQWIWVWVDSGSWWWTGRPGVLWFMGSQTVGHDWVTELNWALSQVTLFNS